MAQALPERPPLRNRRPWSSRTSTASDVIAAIALFISEAVALFLGALLTGSQQDYDRAHPDPTPTPTVHYTPCLSGSGKCH
ncbi:DUF6234 family protein [Streptomyces sp. NPDC058469]|uniref:DUF6234 family protein n=1 Tax=Streptomyces sp. NPDC058469 TaxID=3346514 RepID=UPI0036546A0B